MAKKYSTYRYLNFDKTEEYVEAAKDVKIDPEVLKAANEKYAAFVA